MEAKRAASLGESIAMITSFELLHYFSLGLAVLSAIALAAH
jgi:hypothetical protein